MIIELLACVGAHWILKYGTILNMPRGVITRVPIFDKLFKCSLCLGFWVGVAIGVYVEHNVLMLGLASSGMCWLFDNLNNVIQSAEIKLDKR